MPGRIHFVTPGQSVVHLNTVTPAEAWVYLDIAKAGIDSSLCRNDWIRKCSVFSHMYGLSSKE